MKYAVLVAAAILLLARLGATDLWAPDEPRYGAVAEELRSLEHGARGLVLLHLNGEPYTQKPPLYFWLAALAGAPAGRVSEVAARLPSAVCGIATVWLVIQLGTRMLGGRSGWLGGALLLTAFEFAHRARRAQLDVLLTLCEVTALAAFWRFDRGSPQARRALAVMHGALGLAVLTKGPVGVAVPLLVIAGYLAWERRLADLRKLLPPWALLLSLGPGVAWLAAAAAITPGGYIDEAISTNLFGRFLSGTSHARPAYYYLYQFPVNFLPWTVLWPAAGWCAARRTFSPGADPDRARAWRFLLAWVGATLLFFSLSAGKRGLYLLPAFPAAALLCADAAWHLLAGRRDLPRWATRSLAALTAAIALTGLCAKAIGERFQVAVPGAFGTSLLGVCVAATAGWILAGRARRPALARLAVAVAGAAAVELCMFGLLLPALDSEKSPRPIAAAAAAIAEPDEPIGLFAKPTLVGGLAYYGLRRVIVLEAAGSVERFLSEGGRVIVVPEKHLDRVTRVAPFEIRSRARQGRRAMLVVSAQPANSG